MFASHVEDERFFFSSSEIAACQCNYNNYLLNMGMVILFLRVRGGRARGVTSLIIPKYLDFFAV